MKTTPTALTFSRNRAILLCCILLGATSGGAGGCDDHSQVLIRIEASFLTARQLDTLEVTVTASRTDTGDALCDPTTREFSLDPMKENHVTLPLIIAVLPGQQYDRILYVRVVGRSAGSIQIKTERIVSLQGGEVTLRIPLTSDCLSKGIGRTEHCVEGIVQESPLYPIMDDKLYVEEGTSCLPD